MNLLQTLLAFAVVLGVLISIHEFGHYLAARLCGVKVLRFSLGMGRVIFMRRFGADQTEFALSLLPLGGYVKMLDAREQDLSAISAADLPREFGRQSVWKRMIIVAAGPVANFLLAIVLYAGLFLHGVPEPIAKIRVSSTSSVAAQAGLQHGDLIISVAGQTVQSWGDMQWRLLQLALAKSNAELEVERFDVATGQSLRRVVDLPLKQLSGQDLEADFLARLGLGLARPAAVLGPVLAGGPAAQAGLRQADLVLAVDGVAMLDGLALTETINASPGKELHFKIARGKEILEIQAKPLAEEVNGKTIGRLKIQMMLAPQMVVSSASLPQAVSKSVSKTWDASVMSVSMLGKMLIGEVSLKNITGPITIADYAGQTSRSGWISYISFMALISISLGVMNLLPIPVLDGGHLLYYSLEVLTGKPVPERFGEIAQRVGVALLLAMMAVAFFNDIARLMS